MRLDVVYRCPKDIAWEYIPPLLNKRSIKLALYCACQSLHVIRKSFNTILPQLADDGFLIVRSSFENISDVCKRVDAPGWNKKVILIQEDFAIIPYIIYSKLMGDGHPKTLIEDADNYFLKFSNTQDVCLFVGDQDATRIKFFKNMCRFIVAFSNDPYIINTARNSGISVEEIL